METILKISKITAENFKAIAGERSLDLHGCSVIVTAKNDSGKTSLLRGLIDRFRGITPEYPVNKNAEKGTYIMELDNREKIEWRFTEKSEQINYYTSNGMKITTGVLSFLQTKYFGKQFNIDTFLKKADGEKIKYLTELLGIDVDTIDKEYKRIYEERTALNRDLKNEKGRALTEPEIVLRHDVGALEKELSDIKFKNQKLLDKYDAENELHLKNIAAFNEIQRNITAKYYEIQTLLQDTLKIKQEFLDLGYEDKSDWDKMIKFLESFKQGEEAKPLTQLEKPQLHDTTEIEAKLVEANKQETLASFYERDMEIYLKWKDDIKKLEEKIEKANKDLDDLKTRKEKMLRDANIPEEFHITDEGLSYKGLPLSSSQISTSGLYIAALKLGRLGLGQLQAMHFEASSLDKNNLEEILAWADKENLQLLVERPDYTGDNEMTYKLIEK